MLKVNYKLLLCAFLSSMCLCKIVWINTSKDNDQSLANNVGQLQITPTDVTGWKQIAGPTGFATFSASNFNQDVDGGDDQYKKHHMIEVTDQRLEGASGKQLKSFCFDFGDKTNALDMFDEQAQLITTKLHIPYYNDSVALAGGGIGGIYTVYAYFKKFYIEMQLTGMQDQSEMLQTAFLFLDLYASKIE